MERYRKKPVIIEAVQFTGDNQVEMSEFIDPLFLIYMNNTMIIIRTLEGDHRANVGDWIIKGIKGEFYPCKSDIFEATYEQVEV